MDKDVESYKQVTEYAQCALQEVRLHRYVFSALGSTAEANRPWSESHCVEANLTVPSLYGTVSFYWQASDIGK